MSKRVMEPHRIAAAVVLIPRVFYAETQVSMSFRDLIKKVGRVLLTRNARVS